MGNEHEQLEMPLNIPSEENEESDAESHDGLIGKTEMQTNSNQRQQHAKVLTEDEIDYLIAVDKDNYDAFDPNNYKNDAVVEEENKENVNEIEMEMQRIKANESEDTEYNTENSEDEDAKSPDVDSMPYSTPNIPMIESEVKEQTPNAPYVNDEGDTTETDEGHSIDDDQNVPSPPLAPNDGSDDDQNWKKTRGNDSIYEEAQKETPEIPIYEVVDNNNQQQNAVDVNGNEVQQPEPKIPVVVENQDSEDEEDESSGDEAENTEVRHYTDESESEDEDDDDEDSKPNVVMKF